MTSPNWPPVNSSRTTWRVARWQATDDRRWKIDAYTDHPNGNWPAALTTARQWVHACRDDIEHGHTRINVTPVGQP